jgi:pantetheine-phosphate adenylyltransferase
MTKKPRLGIYAGSFDPFTVGHLDIARQATLIFDNVLVAQGINPEKLRSGYPKHPLPIRFITSLSPNVQSTVYDTLLTDLVKAWEEDFDVTLVRGLRNGNDLEYEQNMIAFLREMHPTIKAVALYCDPRVRHVSSSAVRGLRSISELEYRKYAVVDDYENKTP